MPAVASPPGPVGTALLARARVGDPEAFGALVEPDLRAIHIHCYRMLGSIHDAEDVVQETLLRAWRRLDQFGGRASFRAWLYGIATNACLDVLARRPRRLLPDVYGPPADPTAPPAPADERVPWIEPYPDVLLDEAGEGDPAGRFESSESIELAFVVAIQQLSRLGRAVLILRDVLGFSARETAETLETSVASVNSALQRARAKLARARLDAGSTTSAAALAGDEASIVSRYLSAWEKADVEGLVSLLREDAVLTMPPTPSWYAGREAIAAFFSTLFAGEFAGRLRLLPTRANRQPAFAVYFRESDGDEYEAFALKVLTVRHERIDAIVGFGDPSLFRFFALPLARGF